MRKFNVLLLLFVFIYSSAVADEGMWLPSLIQKLNIDEMQKLGCELSADQIYSINHSSLKDAVVALDHGSCTAELISNDGLLLTNHHCGFGEIQSHSSVEHDYLQDGFWAKSLEEELPNPGKTVSFLIRMEDVTEKVLADVTDDMTEDERDNKIDAAAGELEKEAKGDSHYEVYVRSFFNSNRFYLFVVETFRDIRLVGAPPQALGKFGGDTDNWMWPRHTNDFSMFRVYCSPDGKPATYSEDNVPYHPKHFLPISLKGVKKGDFAMVMGYPGSTNRYKTSYGVNYTMQVTNPVRIKVRSKKLEIIDQYMRTSQKARIQYASKYARSANYYKYSIGQNKGLKNLDVIAKKKALEDKFTSWVDQNENRREKYGEALDLIEESYSNVDINKAEEYMVEALIKGPEIFMFAFRTRPLLDLLEKPEENKERVERVTLGMKSHLEEFYKDYDAATDEKVAAALLKIYADNNGQQFHPDFFAEVEKKYKGDFAKYTEKMYAKSIFTDEKRMNDFLENPSIKALKKDMVFQASSDIFSKFRQIGEMASQESEKLAKGRRLFLAGLMEMEKDKEFYPDANSTMRLTYGEVLDYEPRDGVIYKYYTTAKGYLEKEIPGDMEFDVPARMKELILDKDYGRYADKDGSLHTDFITNNDITGGNSGSPVMNGEGQLIGIAFDGNWEAMSGDIAFEPELQRCIVVDIRFVLWVIDTYAGATNLIDEMEIIQ